MKEADFYEKKNNGDVQCMLCPHYCLIEQNNTGKCRVRKNLDGSLYSLNYNKITSICVDPIEKKPLKNFYPRSLILSAGTFGCNFRCSFCQNWNIAQGYPDSLNITPKQLVNKALKYKDSGNIGLAFTYNEPFIWYEYVFETAALSKKELLKNVLVTNGFVNEKPLMHVLQYIDAMNIDLKAFTGNFYNEVCGGSLEPVKKTIELSVHSSCHVESTTLVIPGLNDGIEEMEQLSSWLASLSKDITLHITRFFPNYNIRDIEPTPIRTLETLQKIAAKNLTHVFLGNV